MRVLRYSIVTIGFIFWYTWVPYDCIFLFIHKILYMKFTSNTDLELSKYTSCLWTAGVYQLFSFLRKDCAGKMKYLLGASQICILDEIILHDQRSYDQKFPWIQLITHKFGESNSKNEIYVGNTEVISFSSLSASKMPVISHIQAILYPEAVHLHEWKHITLCTKWN